MKTIKVFVASSVELSDERKEIIVLFDHLNDIFEKRGFRLKYSGWEKLDASMGRERKQQEYNNEIKTCDICLVLYWNKLGEYTNEELEVAYNELKKGNKPYKLYIYFKEVGELSPEIVAFKTGFEKRYGHFYGKFKNVEALLLSFSLQLGICQNCGVIKVENSTVTIDGYAVASLDNLPFAANNERYKQLKENIEDVKEDIALYEEKYNEIASEVFKRRLDKKRIELRELTEELAKHEQCLFDTAVRMAQYAGERVSLRMQKAIELFEIGKVSEANMLLEGSERDAEASLAEYRKAKCILEANRDNIVCSIDELMLKASVMLADTSYEPDVRIELADSSFRKVIELACECGISKEKYSNILKEYYLFLEKYAKYEKAMSVAKECLELDRQLFGIRSEEVAQDYNNIGIIYNHYQRNYPLALENYHNSLGIRLEVMGEHHPDVAKVYNNIGVVYYNQKEYSLAMENYNRSLDICLEAFGDSHPDVASTYNNIGVVHFCKRDYDDALRCYDMAYAIYSGINGECDPDAAMCLNNIGNVYLSQEKYHEALEMYGKSLEIRLKVFGTRHRLVATSYNNLAIVYGRIGDCSRTIENYRCSYDILVDIFGEHDSRTIGALENIVDYYLQSGDEEGAMEYIKRGAHVGSVMCTTYLRMKGVTVE